jgi:hypothetical protein
MDFITMTHPEVEGSAEVPENAFEEVWEPLGWRRAQPDEGGTSEPSAESTGSGTATDEPPS